VAALTRQIAGADAAPETQKLACRIAEAQVALRRLRGLRHAASRPKESMARRGKHTALFGPPPLFDGEDSKIYDQVVAEISAAVRPADNFENI
jgi:hypothetical protein